MTLATNVNVGWLAKTSTDGKYHICAIAHPEFTDGSIRTTTGQTPPLGDAGLCGRLNPDERYPHVSPPLGTPECHIIPTGVCGDCRRLHGMPEPVETTMAPASVAAFKRAMTPGTRIHIDNTLRPQVSRETVVLPKTNTVRLVTEYHGAHRGSHLAWPLRGGVVSDGDRVWGLLDPTGAVWLTITVLPAA